MLEKLPDNICLDGEITLLDKGNLTSKDQYKETMKITRKKGEKHGVKMLVFDCMSSEEFRNQKCETPYSIRRGDLLAWFGQHYLEEYLAKSAEFNEYEFANNIISFLNTKYTYFNILPILYEGSDINEITKWLNYNIDHGEEGVMINILDAPYSFKRTSDLLKVKKMLVQHIQLY